MIITEKKAIEVESPIKVICDRCKKEFDYQDDIMEIQEFHTISFIGGYSSVFGDESKIVCNICQHCLYELIKDCYREVV